MGWSAGRTTRCDVDGNLWCSRNAGRAVGYNGVTVWNPQAKLIRRIRLPEVGANVCFGGPKRSWLFVAASQSLYAFYVNTQGRPRVNFRTPPGSRLVTSNLETRLPFELGDEGKDSRRRPDLGFEPPHLRSAPAQPRTIRSKPGVSTHEVGFDSQRSTAWQRKSDPAPRHRKSLI
jgi:hypothetical protein